MEEFYCTIHFNSLYGTTKTSFITLWQSNCLCWVLGWTILQMCQEIVRSLRLQFPVSRLITSKLMFSCFLAPMIIQQDTPSKIKSPFFIQSWIFTLFNYKTSSVYSGRVIRFILKALIHCRLLFWMQV